MYFNIHTHKKTFNCSSDEIINLFPSEVERISHRLKYSIGLHPSFIQKKTLNSDLEAVGKFAKKENIIAIGEIGFDKTANIPFDLQLEVFQQQLNIAEELNKPVIIHCVKYFSEIIELKKSSTIPWIIHGFRGKHELTSQLIKKDMYLSFGSAVLNNSPSLYSSILNTPSDRFFLETDDSEIDIKQIYEKVAKIRGISIDMLAKDINKNKKSVFNY